MVERLTLKYETKDAKLNMALRDIIRKINDKVEWILSPTFTTVKFADTDETHYLSIKWNEDETVLDRILNFKVNASDRTIDLSGNITTEAATTLDQDYTSDATVRFAKLGLGMDATHVLDVTGLARITGTACTDYAGVGGDTFLLVENNDNVFIQLQAATTGTAGIEFCDDNYNPPAGAVRYDFANTQMEFIVETNEHMWLTTTELKTDLNFELSAAHKLIQFTGTAGGSGGVQYKDAGGTVRFGLLWAGSDVVALCNRAANGTVELRANTSTAGLAGEVTAVTIEDNLVKINVASNIGDGGATNYAAFAADGLLTLAGTARVTKQIYLNNAAFTKGTTAPTQVILGDLNGWEFDIGDDAVMTIMLPDDWASATALTVKVCWYIDEAYASDKEVQWRIDWSAIPHDFSETVDAPTHSGQEDSGDINIPAVAKRMGTSTIGTISGASLSAGDMLGFKLSRIDVTNDDPTNDPTVHHLIIEYISDKLGIAT